MKTHRHFTPEDVLVLLRGDLSAEAIRLAVGVLLAGCPVCMEVVRQAVLGPEDLRVASQTEDPQY
jgi:hypothetical protein